MNATHTTQYHLENGCDMTAYFSLGMTRMPMLFQFTGKYAREHKRCGQNADI